MLKNKPKFREVVLEIICELGLTLVCFGIGALMLHLFGVNAEVFENIDSELVVLVGIAALLIIFVAVYFLVQLFKKKQRKNK